MNTGNANSVIERSDPCDRCYSTDDLIAITTIVNGTEQKEWVCSDCEPEAREDEKPPLRADGGTVEDGTESEDDCPNCGNDPLECSQTVVVELSGGVEIRGILCGSCGVVYVPEPQETSRVARVNARQQDTGTDRDGGEEGR